MHVQANSKTLCSQIERLKDSLFQAIDSGLAATRHPSTITKIKPQLLIQLELSEVRIHDADARAAAWYSVLCFTFPAYLWICLDLQSTGSQYWGGLTYATFGCKTSAGCF